jgi:hypothetical protein
MENEIHVHALTPEALKEKTKLSTLEGDIYSFVHQKLSDKHTQEEIKKHFPIIIYIEEILAMH